MKRIQLVVAYEGTYYYGWQVQPNGITIEAVLNRYLSQLLRQPITVQGTSRTDAGVHARGNICIFDADTSIPPHKIRPALQVLLPEDIVIVSSAEVAPDWHPRYQPSIKSYEYRLDIGEVYDPTIRFTHVHVTYPLDLDRMQEACKMFEGIHDFAAFCNVKTGAKTTVRTIYSMSLTIDNHVISIRVKGNGFLYNMVRMMVGALLLVGRGNMSLEELQASIYANPSGQIMSKHRYTAPAHGLILDHIQFIKGDLSYENYRSQGLPRDEQESCSVHSSSCNRKT